MPRTDSRFDTAFNATFDATFDADASAVSNADPDSSPADNRPVRLSRREVIASMLAAAAGVALAPFSSSAFAASPASAQNTAASADPASTPLSKRGGKLTMLLNPEPNALINFATTAGAEEKVSPKITEGLLKYDFNVQPHPQLATAWKISADGLAYTFILRQGVKWHDGQPFVSQDVATSVQLLKKYHSQGRVTFANVTEIQTPDDHTVVLKLSKPAPYLIYALAASKSPIVPSHLYASGDPLSNPHNIKPVGTGPYRYKEWVRGSHATLVRNPDYWDAPKPYIDELVLSFIGDAGAVEAALQTGELDLADQNPVPLSDIRKLQALPHLAADTNGYSYDAEQTQIQFNLDNQYLAIEKVRHAIGHSIDRKAILDNVFYGYGTISPSPISPLLTQFYDPTVAQWPHDRKRAEQLLDEAGFPRKANNYRFSLFIDYNPYDPSFARLAQYLRQALRAVGIEANVRSQDFGTYVKRIYTDRDFDIDANDLGNTFDPTVGVQRLYWSGNFKIGVPFSNATHYHNPEVDHLLEAAAVEIDPNKRIELFKQFQQKVSQDLPIYNLITLRQVTLYNKRVHNHTVTADGLRGNLADVYLD